ncbi:FtsX-like permease family protein [uncultured Bifidobacterium sp.]|uniref:ABC transporter permease n=1 Tax=uncultured Bifidobacterium sp. TaxID=165187 RepID=UPI0028DB3D0E|nr:FtsX-like permease family protein [uncultured Bifidobacterium sp.]
MWSITRKLMAHSARMLIPAGIAILIGTAFIACTLLFGNTMNDSLRTQMTAQFGQADYVVTLGGEDDTVGALKLDDIARVDGVTGVRADASVDVSIVSGDSSASTLAIATASDPTLLPVSIVSGRQPTGDGQIALPRSVARQLGVSVGSTVTVEPGDSGMGSAVRSVTVTGLTSDPNGAYTFYGGAAVISDDALATVGGYDGFDKAWTSTAYLDVDASRADAAISDVKALLPSGSKVESREAAADEAVSSLSSSGVSIVTTFLLSFGVLAMVVAALVIANTFQVLVTQRRRTLALLRTIGATSGQLHRSVIVEALVLGLVSSTLGAAAGIGVMAAVCGSGVLASLGLNARLVLSVQAVVVPVVFGVVVTVLASLGAARSATAVTPLEALRPLELTDTRRSGRVRAVIGVLLLLAGCALAAYGFWRVWDSLHGGAALKDTAYETALLSGIAGCALAFLGLTVTAVFWMPWAMRLGGMVASWSGPSGTVAAANVRRNPRRVAATGTALLIGVTLVSCIATGAQSAKRTMTDTLDTRYSVDVVAQGESLGTDDQAKVERVSGVERTVLAPTATATVHGEKDSGESLRVLLVGVDGASDLRSVMRADLSGSSIDAGTALAPEYSAWSGKRLDIGSRATFDLDGDSSSSTASSSGSLRLAVTRADYRRVSSDYPAVVFVDSSLFSDGTIDGTGSMLLVKIDQSSTSSMSSTFEALQKALEKSGSVSLTGPIAEREQWETTIDSMMAVLVGLLGVAVIIALIGVANTLSLSVIERTRESATLRAIGMTRGQLRRSLAIEALVIALVAGVAGVLLGIGFGWLGAYMVFAVAVTPVLAVNWGMTGLVLAVAAVAAVLASVFPARRAVSVPPVRALAEA